MTITDARPVTAPRDGNTDDPKSNADLRELVLRRIQDHVDRHFPGEAIDILGTFGDVLEAFGKELIDEQELRDHMLAVIQHGRWRQVLEQICQIRSNTTGQRHSVGGCPPWCASEAHATPIDICHASEIPGVELTHHPFEVRGQTHLSEMLAMLRQEPGAAEPLIYLTGQDACAENVMTLAEATEVRDMLARLVATGRAGLRAQPNAATSVCPPWCEENHEPIELDDGRHCGPLLVVRDVDRDNVHDGRLVLDLLLSLRRQPDLKGARVVISEMGSAEELLLIPDEAEEMADKLLELAAITRMEPDRPA
ncbi:DUF6907 domain-containing protein [Actinomadura sp. SCN-SB]|uniref:DUF6907 domain-containing protein n=1 Tax=Actinomadura sp. SCN-SB TaxID=3373092 RepID=UPI003752F7E2